MANGDYKLIKDNGTTYDEKTVSAVDGKVLGFDSSKNPVVLSVPISLEITTVKQLTAAEYAALTPKVSTTLYVIVG